jgi:biopolymer transport protein ExbD
MTWHIRHEGSPTTAAVTPQQIIQGLSDGIWDVTDEVRGPTDKTWIPLESHPFFEEALADYEPPRSHQHDVEEHLDMNPLIDVALVLLIFFILTTSYDALRKVIQMPTMSKKDKSAQRVVQPDEVKAEYVYVKIKTDGKNTTYEVDKQPVPEEHLVTAMRVGWGEKRTKTIIDADEGVNWGAICTVMSAAHEAKVDGKILMKAN